MYASPTPNCWSFIHPQQTLPDPHHTIYRLQELQTRSSITSLGPFKILLYFIKSSPFSEVSPLSWVVSKHQGLGGSKSEGTLPDFCTPAGITMLGELRAPRCLTATMSPPRSLSLTAKDCNPELNQVFLRPHLVIAHWSTKCKEILGLKDLPHQSPTTETSPFLQGNCLETTLTFLEMFVVDVFC